MIEERIKELIFLLHKNPNSFAQEIGVSGTVIYNILGGRKSKPSYEVLEKIKQVYPQTNMNWLVHGEGAPLSGEDNIIPTSQLLQITERVHHIEKLSDMRDLYVTMLSSKVAVLKKDQSYSDQIKQLLVDAGVDPTVIRDFLRIQIEVLREVNYFNKQNLSKEEYLKNEIKATQVSILKDLLD